MTPTTQDYLQLLSDLDDLRNRPETPEITKSELSKHIEEGFKKLDQN